MVVACQCSADPTPDPVDGGEEQADGERDEDRRFDGLEGPEVACGVHGQRLAAVGRTGRAPRATLGRAASYPVAVQQVPLLVAVT